MNRKALYIFNTLLHKTPSQNSQVPLSSKFVHFTVENFPFQVGLCYFTFGNCT